jgi:hypothetical protein
MSLHSPILSLIVPTRGRPVQLQRLLNSIASTARNPERIEVVLVVDGDDAIPDGRAGRLNIKIVVGPPGRTMGELNNDGYRSSTGDYVMLLNDDVIIRTRNWDRTVLSCFRRFPDPVCLVHVNDTLIRDYLCTFPLLSRAYCELFGGICPLEYERYRIDDHIEDVFDMLAFLGVRRSVYLPEVIFEHCNSVNHPTAGAVYESDPVILARDAPRFDALLPARKETALKVLEFIEGGRDAMKYQERRKALELISHSFMLRTPGRQHVLRTPWIQRAPRLVFDYVSRIRHCYQRGGARGMLQALSRRLRII